MPELPAQYRDLLGEGLGDEVGRKNTHLHHSGRSYDPKSHHHLQGRNETKKINAPAAQGRDSSGRSDPYPCINTAIEMKRETSEMIEAKMSIHLSAI